METIWPRSSSPCSGVLKFRLASNASANVASAVSLAWVMGLLDTFREVDPGPRDRLGSVSYSKRLTRATRDRGVRISTFRARKKFSGGSCAARTANLDWGSLSRRMLHRRCQRRGRSQRIAMGFGALRRGCLLRLLTRRDRCDGQRTSKRFGSNALWWLSTDRERARETRDRGPLRFWGSRL